MAVTAVAGVFLLAVLLAAGLVVGGLVAGIVLLIVGLAGQRKGLWLSGAIVGAVCLGALLGGVVVSLRVARRRWQQARTAQFQQAATMALAATPPLPLGLKICTGLALPPGAAVSSSPVATEEAVGCCFRVGPAEGLEDQFKARYQPATWEEVSKPMSGEFLEPQSWWDPERIRAARCYRGTHTDEFGSTYKVFAAYDPANQVLYCVAVGAIEDISEALGGLPLDPPGEEP